MTSSVFTMFPDRAIRKAVHALSKTPAAIGRAKMSHRARRTTDAVEILDRMVGDDSRTRELVERATANALIAKLIYEARTSAHLTQRQLAELIGTQQPVIARLEDANYRGHSLTMLQRIATALNRRVEIRLSKCA